MYTWAIGYFCHLDIYIGEKKAWFDNTVEHGRKPRILTGRDIYAALRNFQNEFGKGNKKKKRKRNDNVVPDSDNEDNNDVNNDYDSEELSRWKKRSIFFNLSYWQVSVCHTCFPFSEFINVSNDSY